MLTECPNEVNLMRVKMVLITYSYSVKLNNTIVREKIRLSFSLSLTFVIIVLQLDILNLSLFGDILIFYAQIHYFE